MRGGFIFALDDRLFTRAAAALTRIGETQVVDDHVGNVAQYADAAGRLFTLYAGVESSTEWEVHEGPFATAPGVEPPDMRAVIACPFECRWPDLTAEVANAIARTSEAPTWILDGNGVIWDAEAVDSRKVRL